MVRFDSAPFRLLGLGIDLISISRARKFLSRHRTKVAEKLLSASERKFFLKKRLTTLQFSRLFTAKEAYFKACGGDWLGIEGFSSIEIEPVSKSEFRVSSLAIKPKEEGRIRGVFFEDKNFVGAEVVIWAP